jgi:hypothetical protein
MYALYSQHANFLGNSFSLVSVYCRRASCCLPLGGTVATTCASHFLVTSCWIQTTGPREVNTSWHCFHCCAVLCTLMSLLSTRGRTVARVRHNIRIRQGVLLSIYITCSLNEINRLHKTLVSLYLYLMKCRIKDGFSCYQGRAFSCHIKCHLISFALLLCCFPSVWYYTLKLHLTPCRSVVGQIFSGGLEFRSAESRYWEGGADIAAQKPVLLSK